LETVGYQNEIITKTYNKIYGWHKRKKEYLRISGIILYKILQIIEETP
jgi:hypothetical protein